MKEYKVTKVMFTKEQIAEKVAELGEQISRDYKGKKLVTIGILKGCFVFMADLCRHIHDVEISTFFMQASSYGASTKTTGNVQIVQDLEIDISGEDVLIVEDILDSGYTLSYIKSLLLDRGAKSVKICTIFSKPARHKVPLEAEYMGFEIPDEFVVGYGLDVAERYRNLPYLGVVEEAE